MPVPGRESPKRQVLRGDCDAVPAGRLPAGVVWARVRHAGLDALQPGTGPELPIMLTIGTVVMGVLTAPFGHNSF